MKELDVPPRSRANTVTTAIRHAVSPSAQNGICNVDGLVRWRLVNSAVHHATHTHGQNKTHTHTHTRRSTQAVKINDRRIASQENSNAPTHKPSSILTSGGPLHPPWVGGDATVCESSSLLVVRPSCPEASGCGSGTGPAMGSSSTASVSPTVDRPPRVLDGRVGERCAAELGQRGGDGPSRAAESLSAAIEVPMPSVVVPSVSSSSTALVEICEKWNRVCVCVSVFVAMCVYVNVRRHRHRMDCT